MRTNKVKCDKCEKNLTISQTQQFYRIELRSERIPDRINKSGGITILGNGCRTTEFDILSEDYHFCSTKCLKDWADNNL